MQRLLLSLFSLFLFVDTFSAHIQKSNQYFNTKIEDSLSVNEEVIYEIDTVFLPSDTIQIFDTLKNQKAVPKKNISVKKQNKQKYYTEILGSLWAFSAMSRINNEQYSTNILSNQQIVFNIGKTKSNWMYYLRFTQSRYSEYTQIRNSRTKTDTILTQDSIYFKTYILTHKTLLKNYYVYSYIGSGIATQVDVFRNRRFAIHPSIFGGVFFPWNTKSFIQTNESINSEKVRVRPSIQVGMSCGLYIKLNENMKIALVPEYSHVFVFYNNQPYTNKNIFNSHIGIHIIY